MSTDLIVENQPWALAVLQLPEDAAKLNNWLFETIQPFIKGRIMEMDSGVGAMTSFFVEKGISLRLSDTSKSNRDKLREIFRGLGPIKGIYNIDYHRPDFEQIYSSVIDVFNTVIALNIIDHGFYDKAALRNAKFLLRKRGHLMVVAPAYTAMYDGFDELPENLKKYNHQGLRNFLNNDFEILKARYFILKGNSRNPVANQLGLSVLAIARKK
jgi:SAM-dependent methyltransferase